MLNQCVQPNEVREGDLASLLEGSAPERVIEHVRRCPACAEEARGLHHAAAAVSGALYRDECPATEELLLLHAKLLTRAEQKPLNAHLARCPDCRSELELLAAPFEAAPRVSFLDRIKEAARPLITAVLAPSIPLPRLALRGEARSDVVYHAGEYEVMLALVPPDAMARSWQLEGQITRRTDHLPVGPDVLVHLVYGEVSVASDHVDEFGYFALDKIVPGDYNVFIEIPSASIMIEKFTVA